MSTQTVPIYATVLDGQRRLVTDLQREDFEVYDNGKLQTLTNFVSETTPFTAVVMLDTSGSMTLNLDFVKMAAEEFLIRHVARGQGQGRCRSTTRSRSCRATSPSPATATA